MIAQVSWLGLVVGSHLAFSPHSSNESELSLCRDGNTINIVVLITIIVISVLFLPQSPIMFPRLAVRYWHRYWTNTKTVFSLITLRACTSCQMSRMHMSKPIM